MRFQVTAWRPDGADRDRTIDQLRTGAGDLSPDQVAQWIENGHSFFVMARAVLGHLFEVDLEIGGRNMMGRRWVRTKPNGVYDDNLYALPKF